MSYKVVSGKTGETCAEHLQNKLAPEEMLVLLRKILENGERIPIVYEILAVNDETGHYAASCRVGNVTRVAEIQLKEHDSQLKMPIRAVYDRAFLFAAAEYLQIRHEEEHEEPPMEDLRPDERLRIGNLKGQKYEDIKDTPQFIHFLEQISSNKEMKFQDPEKMEQWQKLVRLAEKHEMEAKK